jgi:hypothetical protein
VKVAPPYEHSEKSDMSELRARAVGLLKMGLFALVLGSWGCGSLGPAGCTDEFLFGVLATVVDAVDGSPVIDGLVGTLTEGQFREEMGVFGNTLQGAGERAGRYDLTVMAEGYDALTLSPIQVESDACHVKPVNVTVGLNKSTVSG